MTRAIVTVTADNADVWHFDEGLVVTQPGQPVVLLAGDVDDLHRLLNRCHESLVACHKTLDAVPGNPVWAQEWRELVDEYEALAGRLT